MANTYVRKDGVYAYIDFSDLSTWTTAGWVDVGSSGDFSPDPSDEELNDIILSGYLFLGDPDVNNSMRIFNNAGVLTSQKKVNGTWTAYDISGSTGVQGVQGITGSVGNTGTIGITGTRGITGTVGLTGSVGITGTQGITGTVGITGTAGITGTIGITGQNGVQGLTGTVGITGTQGITGMQGITGEVA